MLLIERSFTPLNYSIKIMRHALKASGIMILSIYGSSSFLKLLFSKEKFCKIILFELFKILTKSKVGNIVNSSSLTSFNSTNFFSFSASCSENYEISSSRNEIIIVFNFRSSFRPDILKFPESSNDSS